MGHVFKIDNIPMEVNSDYWHGNHLFFPSPSEIQKIIRDTQKKAYIEQNTKFKLITFWEYQIINNRQIIEEKTKQIVINEGAKYATD